MVKPLGEGEGTHKQHKSLWLVIKEHYETQSSQEARARAKNKTQVTQRELPQEDRKAPPQTGPI